MEELVPLECLDCGVVVDRVSEELHGHLAHGILCSICNLRDVEGRLKS
jgi:hypothetical protein